MNDLIIIGINHRTAPVKVREGFAFSGRKLKEAYIKLGRSRFLTGAVILSTCNRSEIYFCAPDKEKDFENIKSFIFSIFNAKETDIGRYFYILEGEGAIKHLFRVASGLDSQVLGETQILGQVKTALLLARSKEATNLALDSLFSRAQEVGKIVRLKTRISQGNISIGSVAIKMLEERFKDLGKRSVLIIGAGKIGALVSKYLKEKNMRGIFVANRTYSRALQLAANCEGKAVDFYGLTQGLKDVDIVISSTSSPHTILRKELVERVMSCRKTPLFIMDLALPRDVEQGVGEIDGVFLCDLDDLKCAVDANQGKKEIEALAAEKIVQVELRKKICLANKKSIC